MRAASPTADEGATVAGRWSRAKIWLAASAAAVIVLLGGLALPLLSDSHTKLIGLGTDAAATFVGSEACTGCHRSEAELWRGSQHKLAMQHASENTVLGDFNDARFTYSG